jgi:hypothetical protein
MSDQPDTPSGQVGEPSDVAHDGTTDAEYGVTDGLVNGTGDMARIDRVQSDTIELSVSVDVSDMDDSDKKVIIALSELFERNFRELINKNRDYGFSFLRTGCKLAGTDADPFDSPTRSQVYGLLTRSGDKRERVIENVYGEGDATVSDDPYVTARECANYWLFMALVLKRPDLAGSVMDC